MGKTQMEELTREQLALADMISEDEKLALVAINSFVTAFELLRSVG